MDGRKFLNHPRGRDRGLQLRRRNDEETVAVPGEGPQRFGAPPDVHDSKLVTAPGGVKNTVHSAWFDGGWTIPAAGPGQEGKTTRYGEGFGELLRVYAAARVGEIRPAQARGFLSGERKLEPTAPRVTVHQQHPDTCVGGGLGYPDCGGRGTGSPTASRYSDYQSSCFRRAGAAEVFRKPGRSVRQHCHSLCSQCGREMPQILAFPAHADQYGRGTSARREFPNIASHQHSGCRVPEGRGLGDIRNHAYLAASGGHDALHLAAEEIEACHEQGLGRFIRQPGLMVPIPHRNARTESQPCGE